MKLRKVTAAAAAVLVLALTATACGRRQGRARATVGRQEDHHRHQVRPAGPRPEDARTASSPASTSTSPRTSPRNSATTPRTSTFKETKSADRETAIAARRREVHRRHLLDQRRAQAEGRLRRPVPARPPGPAGPRRRQHRSRAEDLNGKKLCSVTGSTSAQNVKEKLRAEGRPAGGRRLLGVPHRPGERAPSTR